MISTCLLTDSTVSRISILLLNGFYWHKLTLMTLKLEEVTNENDKRLISSTFIILCVTFLG